LDAFSAAISDGFILAFFYLIVALVLMCGTKLMKGYAFWFWLVQVCTISILLAPIGLNTNLSYENSGKIRKF